MASSANVQLALAGLGRPRFVLVSDLDHTMVQNEDPTHQRLQAFNRLWSVSFAHDSLLVFSTGRSPHLFCQLWDEAPLLNPDVLICSVGTEIFYRAPDGAWRPDTAWTAHLDRGWDRDAVAAVAGAVPQLTPQVASEQRRHKLSFHLQRSTPEADAAVLDGLRAALAAAGQAAKVIYSGGVDVDVLAAGAGKGKALEFILRELQDAGAAPADGVQVNGDSGNDVELFEVPGVRGCVVANAHAELRAFADAAAAAGGAAAAAVHAASAPCAGGIVEALHAFDSVPAPPPPEALLRGTVSELGLLQSSALAGNVAALAAPGATWVTPAGRVLRVDSLRGAPADAAAAGLTWVDAVAARALPAGGDGGGGGGGDDAGALAPGQLVLATYQLWSFTGQARDSTRVRACSALLRAADAGDAGGGGFKLLHLHESVMARDATPTAAFEALARASGGGATKRGILGAPRYESDDDSDFRPPRYRGSSASDSDGAGGSGSDAGGGEETLAQRRARLVPGPATRAAGRAPPSKQPPGDPPLLAAWDNLPRPVLAKIFGAACAAGALPAAPRLACVCSAWAAAVSEAPELWAALDTAHLPARARRSAKPAKKARGRGGGPGGGGRVPASADAGLRAWAESGRLARLARLRLSCPGTAELSLEDPTFFADEAGRGAGGAGGPEVTAATLAALAARCPELRSLTISGAPAFRAEELADALLAMPALVELHLAGVRMTPVAGLDAAVRRVLDEAAATGRPALTRLVAESCPMLGKRTLTELDLSCSATGVGGGIELQLEGLQAAMPLLQVLKLSGLGGFYGWTASVRSAAALPGFPRLHTLHVGAAMLQLPSGLLRMGSSNVGDDVLLWLASKSPGLADLDLSGTNVTVNGLAGLAAELAALKPAPAPAPAPAPVPAAAAAEEAAAPRAAEGGAAGGGGAEGAEGAAAAALPSGLALTRVHLSRARGLADDAGLVLLGQLTGDSLVELVLRNAGAAVSDAGLRALRGCGRLTSLDLTSSSVTEAGLRDLLAALPGLQELTLGSCRSLSRGARQAANGGLPALKRLLARGAD
ncbi:SPP1 [Scenedesmus sp. PABB004]|nr:SPP1 [Scenedesmus sp. PABB004]